MYHIRMTEETVSVFHYIGGFFRWQAPYLPEDLCLFANGRCWLRNTAHERDLYIYDNSPKVKEILRKYDDEILDTHICTPYIHRLEDLEECRCDLADAE